MRSNGYTLAEMLAVVAVLGTISLAAVPTAAPQDEIRVDAAAAEIAAALNFARSEAMRTGDFYGANISAVANRARVYKLNIGAAPPSQDYVVYHPLDKKLYDLQLGATQFSSNVRITLSEFKFTGSLLSESVTFNRYGAPIAVLSATSSAQLLTDSKAIVSLQGITKQVRLDPETGRVTRL